MDMMLNRSKTADIIKKLRDTMISLQARGYNWYYFQRQSFLLRNEALGLGRDEAYG